MAHAAFRTWDRIQNASAFENKNIRKALRIFLKGFDTAAHTEVLSTHIKRFGDDACIFYTIHDDMDAQAVLGVTFTQARNAILAGGGMRHNFSIGDLSGCAVCITLQSRDKNIFTFLACRPPVETIVIAGAYFG